MNIALIGYGKMGKVLEAIAIERGHTISLRVDSRRSFLPQDLAGSDVALEFSTPATAADNILRCFEAHCPVVVGSTGWYQRFSEIRTAALNGSQSLLHATNFSIGVNILFHLNRELARIMNRFDEFEPEITEIHHTEKLDKPSGTAITLAEGIMDEISRKTSWINEPAQHTEALGIVSIREGAVTGKHTICYTGRDEHISLTHEATDRRCFAAGAIHAATWLMGKKGVYSIHDFLKF